MLRHKNFTGLRLAQAADQRQESGFANGAVAETFESQMILILRIFKGMELFDDLDMDKIADRLKFALLARGISCQRAAREMGVSRDLIFDYTNPKYSEDSMQPQMLVRFADYLGEEKYYFCNEYHKFLDAVDGGRFLLEIRKKYNVTQRQFADYLGIPLASFKKYENGKGKLPKRVFDQLKGEIEPLLP